MRRIIDVGGGSNGGTARRIEDAALQLFFDRGYPSTTMREIAMACGLTAGALYNHFPSKDQILVSIVERVHEELERLLLDAAAAAGDDPGARLAALVRAHALFHTRYRHEARVANQEIGSLPEDARAGIVTARKRMRAMFEDVLTAGTRSGAFSVENVKVAALAILNMGIRIAEWFVPGGPLTDEQVAEMHATLAVRMVRA